MFPERFSNLPAYAFPRLRSLLDSHEPGGDVIHMTIGEPKHEFPQWVTQVIVDNAAGFNRYPPNEGAPELQQANADWLERRFGAKVDAATQIMALNGTREGLYNATMALCPETKNGETPIILIPNPFYQVYMVGAISVAAEPYFCAATAENGFMPDYSDLPEDVLKRVAVAFICSPSNPQGAIAKRAYMEKLIALAEKYDFKIFSDECYSEIYRDVKPESALKVVQDMGADPERVLVFHSLSKRSNLPGLRSGFVASGPKNLQHIKQLRTYSGSPLPLPLQRAAEKVWADEAHVEENRRLYAEKFEVADRIFADVPGYATAEAGFFLWLPVEDGEAAALKLWTETGVRVLPGAYLARDVDGENPGKTYIRVALLAPKNDVEAALKTIHACLYA